MHFSNPKIRNYSNAMWKISLPTSRKVEDVCDMLKLRDFQKFDSAAVALEEAAAIVEGKVTPRLASMLESLKDEKKISLAVADPKLGNAIGKIPGSGDQSYRRLSYRRDLSLDTTVCLVSGTWTTT